MATTLDQGFDKAFDEAVKEHPGTDAGQAAAPPTKEAEAAASATTTPAEEKGTESALPPEGSEELLPQEEYDKLRDKPEELRKALNKAFTQKTQALAEQRKAFEPYQELVSSLQEDPQGTVRALAERLGIKLEQAETKVEAKEAVSELLTDLKQSLGPDLEFLADKLAPVLERIVGKLAGQAVSKEVEPLKQQAKALREEAIVQQVDANIEAFTDKHPDFQKHEAKMTEIGMRLHPAPDPKTGKPPTWMEYMEDLYYLATKDVREGDITKKTVERMKESAEKSEPSEGGVASNRVTKAAPKGKTFDEAFEQSWKDAAAGVVYE